MIDKLHNLDVSAEELAVIEAALHTQAKILAVQANAGGKGSISQLNQVKRALATVSQQKPCQTGAEHRCKPSWFGMSRVFG
jgi:hypothetical protein